MKKLLLIAGIATITVLSLSSCKKTCVCKEGNSTRLQTIEISSGSCLSYAQAFESGNNPAGQHWTCK